MRVGESIPATLSKIMQLFLEEWLTLCLVATCVLCSKPLFIYELILTQLFFLAAHICSSQEHCIAQMLKYSNASSSCKQSYCQQQQGWCGYKLDLLVYAKVIIIRVCPVIVTVLVLLVFPSSVYIKGDMLLLMVL